LKVCPITRDVGDSGDHGDFDTPPPIFALLLQTKDLHNSTLGRPSRGPCVALGWPLGGPWVALGWPKGHPSPDPSQSQTGRGLQPLAATTS